MITFSNHYCGSSCGEFGVEKSLGTVSDKFGADRVKSLLGWGSRGWNSRRNTFAKFIHLMFTVVFNQLHPTMLILRHRVNHIEVDAFPYWCRIMSNRVCHEPVEEEPDRSAARFTCRHGFAIYQITRLPMAATRAGTRVTQPARKNVYCQTGVAATSLCKRDREREQEVLGV